ncbi:flavin reductase family protein [Hydrogenovibrio kuenenii]|uniref:flavin reductase family protein n=1 Tax=Hydrogenovibrio kuenenii TaxID=63658 RepID=UPI0004669D7D|nr:flavin reductase family protein [Hydrogenovibrio kuenenii]
MNYTISELNDQPLYPLLVGGIIPRPIAWISTLSKQGIDNLAPYSFFSVASSNPPILTVTQINAQTENDKDTLSNLKETHECVINIVSQDLAELMNETCAQFPADISEFEAVGVTACKSEHVRAKSVAEAKVRYECRLREVVTLSEQPGGGKLILLDVLSIYVDDKIMSNGVIQSDQLRAVGKLGGNEYTIATQDFSIARP